MAKVGFIGLGNIGLSMAQKLEESGHDVIGFDVSEESLGSAKAAGIKTAKTLADAVKSAEVVFNTVPERKGARGIYLDDDGILKNAKKGALLIDCSTVYAAPSREIHEAAEEAGHPLLDAPISGGVEEAQEGKLSFMVAGEDKAFERAQPFLSPMADEVYQYGPHSDKPKTHTTEVTSKVVYKKNPWWRKSSAILVLLFLGGNAVFFALIEDSIRMSGNRLTVSLDLGDTERSIFCRGSNLIGLDIDGC
jgi:hypothetical protein